MIAPLLFAALLPTLPVAEPVVVIMDRDTKAYRLAIDGLELAGQRVERLIATDPTLSRRLAQTAPEGSHWLAMGPRSAQALVRASTRRRAALFLRGEQVPAGMAAVTLEVDYTRQLEWIKRAFPGRRRIIVIRKPDGAAVRDPELRAAADRAEVDLVIADVQSPGAAVPALEAVLRGRSRGAVLWLLPDPVAVNGDTVPPLIQTAMAARVPVIGFSTYFLGVGALAAVSVDYAGCGPQALELATAGEARVVAPRAASLIVDGRLAERLGIAVGAGEGIEVRR